MVLTRFRVTGNYHRYYYQRASAMGKLSEFNYILHLCIRHGFDERIRRIEIPNAD